MIQLNLNDIEAVLDRANDDADRVSVYEYREALNAVYRTAMRILSEKMTVERERDAARSQLAELHAVACRVSREMEYHAASISNEGNQALRRLADILAGTAGSADGIAAQDVERLRRLSDSKNAQRIAAEHRAMVAERERDELRACVESFLRAFDAEPWDEAAQDESEAALRLVVRT